MKYKFSKSLKLNKDGLLPAIIQDFNTKKVLMMAWMNEKAIKQTIKTGKCYFWSRSRKKLWLKGEESKNFQVVKEILIDCDNDTLLIKVKQIRAACHNGYYSCFYRKLENGRLKIIEKRIFNPNEVYK